MCSIYATQMDRTMRNHGKLWRKVFCNKNMLRNLSGWGCIVLSLPDCLFPHWKPVKQKGSLAPSFSSLMSHVHTYSSVGAGNKVLTPLLQFPLPKHHAPCWKQPDCIYLSMAPWSSARRRQNETEPRNFSHTFPPLPLISLWPEMETHSLEGWTVPEKQHLNQTLLKCRQ